MESARVAKLVVVLSAAAAAILGLFVVPALAGSPADQVVLSPGARAQLAASERQTEAAEARRRAWLSSPDAKAQRQRSRTAYATASADRALAALNQFFAPQLKASSRSPVDGVPGQITQFVNDHVARIVTPAGRRELSESSYPLRANGRPVDLNLVDSGTAALAPANPLVPVTLPNTLSDGVSVGPVRVFVPALGGATGVKDGRAVVYHGLASDVIAAPTAAGVEVSELVRSPAAAQQPEVLRLALPSGISLTQSQGGALLKDSSGKVVGLVSPPAATDAQGTTVPVSMSVSGPDLTLRLQAGDVAYPVLIDPVVDSNGATWYATGSGVGLDDWGFHNFSSNPYSPRTTCYSPVDCEGSGVGLYIYAINATYNAGPGSYWTYTVPGGSQSYISNVDWNNIYVQHHGDLSAQPYPYVAIYGPSGIILGSETSWPTVDVINGSAVSSAGGSTVGYLAAMGFANDSTNTTTQWRSFEVGGTVLTLDDTTAPSVSVSHTNSTIAAGGWVGPGQSDSATGTATSGGLGVASMTLALANGSSMRSASCAGTIDSPCPASWSQSFSYSSSSLSNGSNQAVLTATDAPGHSGTATWPVKVDTNAPSLTVSGTAWHPTTGSITPANNTIIANSSNQNSGVQYTQMSIDGTPVSTQNNTCNPGANQGCNQTQAATFTVDTSQYSQGTHTVTITSCNDATPATCTSQSEQETFVNANVPGGDPCSASATTIATGMVANTLLGVQFEQPTSQTLKLCYQVADPVGAVDQYGVLTINTPVPSIGAPNVDGGGNQCLPPYKNGSTLFDDNTAAGAIVVSDYSPNASQQWLCVQAPGLSERVIVNLPSGGTPTVVFGTVTPTPPFAPAPPAWPAGVPSARCMLSGGTLLADYDVAGTQVWLADAGSPAGGTADLCVREQGANGSLGGVVAVNTGNLGGLLPGISTDLSPCTVPVNDLNAPVYLHVDASPVGSNPQSACVSAGVSGPVIGERIFAGTGSSGPVSFTPDPGTP